MSRFVLCRYFFILPIASLKLLIYLCEKINVMVGFLLFYWFFSTVATYSGIFVDDEDNLGRVFVVSVLFGWLLFPAAIGRCFFDVSDSL